MKVLITNLKETINPGVVFIKVTRGNKPRIAKKIMRLSPQSTAHVPFVASTDVFSVSVTQAQLE